MVCDTLPGSYILVCNSFVVKSFQISRKISIMLGLQEFLDDRRRLDSSETYVVSTALGELAR